MIQLCPDNTVLTKSVIHDIGKHFTKQSFIYFSELNFRSFSYNHFPKDSFLNKVVSTLRTKKNTKVESSLLQIDPALCWNFSQTILNFFFWHPLFWLVLFLVVCHCLLICFDFFKKCLGKVPHMSWVNLK